MRVLICNDDGVAAPGIAALARRLAREHEVTVVAPAVEQSGMGHRTTYLAPIFVKEAKSRGWTRRSTPFRVRRWIALISASTSF